MSQLVRTINEHFRNALKIDIDHMAEQLALSDKQYEIFYRYYVRKQNIDLIADELHMSPESVSKELKYIRRKIARFLGY